MRMIEVVKRLRKEERKGFFLTLIPYDNKYVLDVIRLRNRDRVKYFLNQSFNLSIDMQKQWAEEYFRRENDIYWVVQCNETKKIIGTTALYDITSLQCEKGRLVMDEAFTSRKPYVLEAELMIIDLAFGELCVEKIVTCTRYDNAKMESINKRLGFVKHGEREIRGIMYNDFILYKSNFKKESLRKTILHWVKREHIDGGA
jgi:RimJ/RimL family protein N-acetyltransferase